MTDYIDWTDLQVCDLSASKIVDTLRKTFGLNVDKMDANQLHIRATEAFKTVAAQYLADNQFANELGITKETLENSLEAMENDAIDEAIEIIEHTKRIIADAEALIARN